MNHLLICSVLFFFSSIAHTSSVELKGSAIEVQWGTSQVELQALQVSMLPLDNQKFAQIISADNTQKMKTPGLPQWPYQSFIVVGDINKLQVQLDWESEEVWKNTLVAPSPLMPCRCQNRAPAWYLVQNHPLLTKNYQLESLGDYRGLDLIKVTLTPFRQEGNSTVYLKNFKFRLEGAKEVFSISSATQVQSQIYVMVAPSEFHQALTPLIEYHRSRGMEVILFNYTNQSFSELQRELRSIYKSRPFQYALLVGHENLIPNEYVRTSADMNTPSDMNYFTMGGPEDRIPDVFYGRLVVQDQTQVRDQVRKILDFKSRRFDHKTLLTVASDEGLNPTDIEYANQMASPFTERWGFDRAQFIQGLDDSGAQNIINQLNQGSEWMNYIGHGEGDRWPSITGEALTVDHFQAINQTQRLPVVIDVACQNGRLSLDRRIGERLMNHRSSDGQASGAVAYYGGSVDISWHPPAKMAVYLNQFATTTYRGDLGQIILKAQLKLVETYDDLPSAMENLVWYHLQGDPAMVLDFE